VGLEEGQELEHPLLNRSIQQAQKRVEQHNFQIRKRTLEYDDVMNKQREVIYGFRNEIIHRDDVRDRLMDIMEEVVVQKVERVHLPDDDVETWNAPRVGRLGEPDLPARHSRKGPAQGRQPRAGTPGARLPLRRPEPGAVRRLPASWPTPCARPTSSRSASKNPSSSGRRTLHHPLRHRPPLAGASLRHGQPAQFIGLRAYGQRDPLIEYKAEAFKVFEDLMVNIKSEICHNIFRSASSLMAFEQFLHNLPQRMVHAAASAFGGTSTSRCRGGAADAAPAQKRPRQRHRQRGRRRRGTKAKPVRSVPKVGRNDPCPCGSGKKYKHCCGCEKSGLARDDRAEQLVRQLLLGLDDHGEEIRGRDDRAQGSPAVKNPG
jgi:preprotein translocase subunit SecA